MKLLPLVLATVFAGDLDAASLDVAAMEADLDASAQTVVPSAPTQPAAQVVRAPAAPAAVWQSAPTAPLRERAALLARRRERDWPKVALVSKVPVPKKVPVQAPQKASSAVQDLLATATDGSGEALLAARLKLFESASTSLTEENTELMSSLTELRASNKKEVADLSQKLVAAQAGQVAILSQVGSAAGAKNATQEGVLDAVKALSADAQSEHAMVSSLQKDLLSKEQGEKFLLSSATARGVTQAAFAQEQEIQRSQDRYADALNARDQSNSKVKSAVDDAQAAAAREAQVTTLLRQTQAREAAANATVVGLAEELVGLKQSLASSENEVRALDSRLANATDVASQEARAAEAADVAARHEADDSQHATEVATREALVSVNEDMRSSVEVDLRSAEDRAEAAEKESATLKQRVQQQATELAKARSALKNAAERDALGQSAIVVAA